MRSPSQLLAPLSIGLLLALPACKRPPPGSKGPQSSQGQAQLILKLPQGTPLARRQNVHRVWPLVRRFSRRYHLDPQLVLAIIWVESRYELAAKSHAGARGLMQLMPRTARALTKKLSLPPKNFSEPERNIQLGCYYFARLLRRFKGRQDLALAAYNAGPARVSRWQKTKGLPAQSKGYIRSVLQARNFFGLPPISDSPPSPPTT